MVEDSIIMPGAVVEEGAKVSYSIVAENVVIKKNAKVGCAKEQAEDAAKWGITVIGEGITVGENATVAPKTRGVKNVGYGGNKWKM